jgi:hypothetical protein
MCTFQGLTQLCCFETGGRSVKRKEEAPALEMSESEDDEGRMALFVYHHCLPAHNFPSSQSLRRSSWSSRNRKNIRKWQKVSLHICGATGCGRMRRLITPLCSLCPLCFCLSRVGGEETDQERLEGVQGDAGGTAQAQIRPIALQSRSRIRQELVQLK